MKDMKEITKQLEDGVKAVYNSEEYKRYLDFMGRFYDYSVNNIILIMMQKPEASLVAGYKAWQSKFNRQVRKGEKGITIIAPCPHKYKKDVVLADGTTEEHEFNWTSFRAVSVFDVSQTDGEEIPDGVCKELNGDVADYESLKAKLVAVSPVPIAFEDIDNGANGYFKLDEKRIVVKEGMSEQQTIKTTIHEIAHSILHDKDNGADKEADKHTREVQAESIAYSVCQAIGLDTSDYSFGYIAGWSQGKDVKELTASMELIRKTANQILDGLRAA